MSSIAFTKQPDCNYDDISTSNPALNGIVNIRQAIGLSDKSRWDKEWRPMFMNFIESSNLIAIDLTQKKAKSRRELRTKIWEFVSSVRDEAASNVPDKFLESAMFTLINLLRAQVRSQVKEEPKEEGARPTSFPSTIPAPRQTSVSASTAEARVVPLTGRTMIMLRRINQSGYISSRYAYWSHLAVFPPSIPPTETLPEVATCEISVLHQLLEYHQIWNDKELIYWIDPNGNPFELAGDFDLRSMVFAAQNVQEPNRARETVVKGSDTEPVQWRWSETSRRDMSVRDPVDVKPSVTAKRPSQDLFSDEDKDDRIRKKSRRSGAPSTVSHATSLAIRSSARGRDEKPATGAAEHEQPLASKPKDGKGIATVEIDSNPDSESSDPAADALLKGPSYDSADYGTAAANVIETEACAQMGENDVNWDAAYGLVKADKNRKGTEDDIEVQGFEMRMRKH